MKITRIVNSPYNGEKEYGWWGRCEPFFPSFFFAYIVDYPSTQSVKCPRRICPGF